MANCTIVLVGPSGAGKGTLLSHILETRDDVQCTISVTTRKPRKNEVNGVHYHFVDEHVFRAWEAEGKFLETSTHLGASYGTLVSELGKAGTVVADLDINGARSLRELDIPNLSLIFITVSDPEKVLPERIRARHSSQDVAERRIALAQERFDEETEFQNECNYVIFNDDLDISKQEIEEIFEIIISD